MRAQCEARASDKSSALLGELCEKNHRGVGREKVSGKCPRNSTTVSFVLDKVVGRSSLAQGVATTRGRLASGRRGGTSPTSL